MNKQILIDWNKDTYDNTANAEIFINGNTCSTADAAGWNQHFATGTGCDMFLVMVKIWKKEAVVMLRV